VKRKNHIFTFVLRYAMRNTIYAIQYYFATKFSCRSFWLILEQKTKNNGTESPFRASYWWSTKNALNKDRNYNIIIEAGNP
jgi:hypothetical protein